MTDIAAALVRCRMFAALAQPQRDALAAISRIEDVERGARLFSPGDEATDLCVVLSGLVRVFKTSPAGKEHTLHLCGPGATFAEVAAIDDFPVPAFVEVVEPARLVRIDAPRFRALLDTDHALCRQLLPGLAMWVRHLIGLLEDIVLRDATARVARWIIEAADGDGVARLPAGRRHLALHLNLTPETLSRTLRRLIDDGCLRGDGDDLRILQPARLHQAAQGAFPAL
jgi:CRP-like cAMP-binding protein